jgi:hypothetical protein
MSPVHTDSPRRSRRIIVAIAAGASVLAVVLIATSGHTPHRARPTVAPARTGSASSSPTGDPVDVAVDDATLLARVFPMSAGEARSSVGAIASDAYRATFVAAVDRELVPLQQQAAALPGHTVFRQAVLATRRIRSDQRRAQVSVWMLVIVGQAGEPANPAASFVTVTVDLVAEHDAWKLDHVAQETGPTPLLAGQPDLVDSFDNRLIGFADWRH